MSAKPHNVTMENVTCNLCGSTNTPLLFHTRDRGSGCFQIVRCPDCALVFVNPRPTEKVISAYYPDDYYPYFEGYRTATRLNRLKRWFARAIAQEYDGHCKQKDVPNKRGWWRKVVVRPFRYSLQRLPPYVEGGRILDIGCAVGKDLDLARELGWETVGVEISERAAAQARAKGHQVFTGTLEQASYHESSFHAVVMWDVLEHLHNPLGTLKEISRILKPGGSLLGKALSIYSFQGRVFRDKWWPGMDVPRHLYFYSPRLLADMLDAAGLELAHVSFLSSPRCMAESLQLTWCDFLGRPAWQTGRLFRWVSIAVAWPLTFIVDILRQGDALFFSVIKRRA